VYCLTLATGIVIYSDTCSTNLLWNPVIRCCRNLEAVRNIKERLFYVSDTEKGCKEEQLYQLPDGRESSTLGKGENEILFNLLQTTGKCTFNLSRPIIIQVYRKFIWPDYTRQKISWHSSNHLRFHNNVRWNEIPSLPFYRILI